MVGAALHSGGQMTANGIPFEEVLRMANLSGITRNRQERFPRLEDPKAQGYSMHSFGAHFAEVEWEPEIARSAREPDFFDLRLRPHHQPESRRQPDSGRGGDGRGHGAV